MSSQAPVKSRVSKIVPSSATLAVKTRMDKLKALGVNTISLGAGELKFPLSEHQRSAFKYLAEKAALGYTLAPGLEQLRYAVVLKQQQDYGVTYDPAKGVLITDGGKGALLSLFLTTFGDLSNPDYDGGDEVIYLAPYWVSHQPICEVSGAKMVVVDCPASQNYKVTPDQLRSAITPKTKFIVFTSPGNPSGMLYTDKEWRGMAEVLRENPHVLVVTEDMYEHYVFDGAERTHLLKVAPDLQNQVVCINCFSKSDEMAGERVGYITGPEDIMAAVKALNSNTLGNAPVIGQWLGIAAILGYDQFVLAYENPKAFKAQWEKKGNLKPELVSAFNEISALRNQKTIILQSLRDQVVGILETAKLVVPKPQASFYVFPSIEQLKGLRFPEDLDLVGGLREEDLAALGLQSWAGRQINSGQDFADAAMVHAGVGVVPGQDFGAPDCVRIAYVDEDAIDAAWRLSDLVVRLG